MMPGEDASNSTVVTAEDDSRILDWIRQHGDDLSFTKFFWKKCEPHKYELERYPKYANVLSLACKGSNLRKISALSGVKLASVCKWTSFAQKPKLAYYLGAYLTLGSPRPGSVWLSISNTSGHAVPLGPFIQVPEAISSWDTVAEVLSQITPLEETPAGLSREYMFGFLLGVTIGDAAKSRGGNWHRHLGLTLSKRYATSERIGDFTCQCARNLGLRMHRISDRPRGASKPNDFFDWVSQASALIDWIFTVCLGLRDGERTTYDPVRMDWALAAPEDFRRGLVQGLSESDGSVSIASQTVEFWIGPNWDFVKRLLLTFGVNSFRNREALSVTKTEVTKLGKIPAFSPQLKTVRFVRFDKLVRAEHIAHGRRLPDEIRQFIAEYSKGYSVPQISEKVLDEFGTVISFEAVQRWVRKARETASSSSRGLKAPV